MSFKKVWKNWSIKHKSSSNNSNRKTKRVISFWVSKANELMRSTVGRLKWLSANGMSIALCVAQRINNNKSLSLNLWLRLNLKKVKLKFLLVYNRRIVWDPVKVRGAIKRSCKCFQGLCSQVIWKSLTRLTRVCNNLLSTNQVHSWNLLLKIVINCRKDISWNFQRCRCRISHPTKAWIFRGSIVVRYAVQPLWSKTNTGDFYHQGESSPPIRHSL